MTSEKNGKMREITGKIVYLWQDSSFLFGEQGNDAFMDVSTSKFRKFYFGILGRATCLVPMNSYTVDF